MPSPLTKPLVLDAELVPAPAGANWLVLHARPRCEKKLLELCQQQLVPAYLPLLHQEHRYGRRVRVHSKPLFPGYLFGVAGPEQSQYLRQNRLVANLLPVVEEARFLVQLQSVRLAVESGAKVEILPFMREGRPVQITAGPLKGIEGLVMRWKGKDRVLVNVDMIGYAMAVEVDASQLKPIH